MNRNICFTLAYNLVSETEKAVDLLYKQNDNFEHWIFDLGFPLEQGDVVPQDIEESIKNNTKKLKSLAKKYGSKYVKINNIGVSQNWTQVYQITKPDDDDVLIGVDPDERVLNNGWVNAIGNVIRATENIALCSLLMPEHEKIVKSFKSDFIADEKCLIPNGLINWALIGISGKFLNIIKEIPYPKTATKYGWIEAELLPLFKENGFAWVILPEYKVYHTDYPKDNGTSKLYREWKNDVVFNVGKREQIDFKNWLLKKDGKI